MTSAKDSTPDPAAALLQKWQQDGDRLALDELLQLEVRKLQDRIRIKGRHALGGSVSATDVAQEAVLALLKQDETPRFDHPAAMRSYLWRTAWNRLVDRMRGPDRRLLRLDRSRSWAFGPALQATGGMSTLETADQNIALQVVINLLQPQDQEVIDLVYFRQWTLPQVGDKLGISKEAAGMRVSRARRQLMEKLLDWNDLIG